MLHAIVLHSEGCLRIRIGFGICRLHGVQGQVRGKMYNSDDVEAAHQATYEANMQNVAEVNAQNLGFELSENQFSDLTQDRCRVAAGLGHKAPGSFNSMLHLGEHLHSGAELPAEVKWVPAGAVNPIKHKASVDLAGHFPPLAALMEFGSSSLPSW